MMENGVGKTTVTCDGGIDTHGSWPGVDTQGHWPGQQGNWPQQHGYLPGYLPPYLASWLWPGQQGFWPGQKEIWPGSNIQPYHHLGAHKWAFATAVSVAAINACVTLCPWAWVTFG